LSGDCFQPVLPAGMSGSEEQGRRIGFLGGSFDPVHLGHLMAAQDALEAMSLEKVVFVPTAQSPLKDTIPGITDGDRLELLQTAIAGDRRFEISTVELDRGGVSYTVETVETLSAAIPQARLFWIIGADRASGLKAWHRIDELAARIEFIVLERPGFEWSPPDLGSGIRIHAIRSHAFDVSSSEIRKRVGAGRSVRFLVPEGVATRIENRQLYRVL
jgi:nicotinate-nucleotide adenylyltransferase